MQDFARWIGGMAAAAAAVLAVVWLIEASPEREAPGAEAAICRSEQTISRILMNDPRLSPEERRMHLARAARGCPPPPRTTWDSDLATRGIVAAAGAVILLLLTALLSRGPAAPRDPLVRFTAAEIVAMIEAERDAARRQEGRTITQTEARARVEARFGRHR
jgi:hypothetical protein